MRNKFSLKDLDNNQAIASLEDLERTLALAKPTNRNQALIMDIL